MLAVGQVTRKSRMTMNTEEPGTFGARCAAAWCSQNAESVAAFFEEKGSLEINAGLPS